MWTKLALQHLMQRVLGDRRLIVASNRQPFVYDLIDGQASSKVPVGGLTSAISPLMQAASGVWIAHGVGQGDRQAVGNGNRVMVPPEDPTYAQRLVWLTNEEVGRYYLGFSNASLWPLFHNSHVEPAFDLADWETYRAVNRKFADAILDEINGDPAVVFLQDFHLALTPRMLRQENPSIVVGQFWHIPWPSPDVLRICPWRDEILDGLLGNDLLGFHIESYCRNFLETVGIAMESRVDYGRHRVDYHGRSTLVRPIPISVDFERISEEAQSEAVSAEMDRLVQAFGLSDKLVGLGIDRIDYIKGIPHRLRGLERFLEKYPEYIGKLVFVQAGAMTRTEVTAFGLLADEVENLVDRINNRFSQYSWKPVLYLPDNLPQLTLMALRRLGHFAVVSSLSDGMNLVSKEFVASRVDEDGVLILSPFAGAAEELTDALICNPYFIEEFADTIKQALDMPREERRDRMLNMRATVRENNIYQWAARCIINLTQHQANRT